MTKVSEIMTPEPVCLFGTATVMDAAQEMRTRDIGNVLVMNGEELIGIVTDRDIVVRLVADGLDPSTTSLKEISTATVKTVRPEDDAHVAVELVRSESIRRIPVVDEQGHPVGIVSIGDLAQSLDADSALAQISNAPANA